MNILVTTGVIYYFVSHNLLTFHFMLLNICLSCVGYNNIDTIFKQCIFFKLPKYNLYLNFINIIEKILCFVLNNSIIKKYNTCFWWYH